MKLPKGFFRNPLHPLAVYLDDRAWQNGQLSQFDLPSAKECQAHGVDRFRIILPEKIAPPEDWQLVKQTLFRHVPVKDCKVEKCETKISLRTVSRDDWFWNKWITAHWRIYRRNHKDNPPANQSLKQREQIFGGDDLHNGNGVGIWLGDRMVGFASLRTPANEFDAAESGWIGAWGPSKTELVQCGLNWTISHARGLGFAALDVEVDDTDRILWHQVVKLPTVQDKIYTTWQFEIN